MSPDTAERLLQDLSRWSFGRLLAERACFHALDYEDLSAEVRAYRYGIVCTLLRDESVLDRSLAEPLVRAPWNLMLEWSRLGRSLSWGDEAERALAEHFLSRMLAHGDVSDALKRFARGKAFKYGRRVKMLMGSLA